MSSECPQCKRKIGAKTTCRCGWTMPGTSNASGQPMQKVIACCYEMCDQPAICSVQTKTGRANVCRSHYATIERGGPQTMTPFAVECREAYKRSYSYRQKHGGAPAADRSAERTAIEAELSEVKRRMEAAKPQREPGQDDDDPLAIAANPQAYLDRAQA